MTAAAPSTSSTGSLRRCDPSHADSRGFIAAREVPTASDLVS